MTEYKNRNRILKSGLEQRATSILVNAESDPRKVAAIINKDEGCVEKMRAAGFKTPLKTSDVREFQDYLNSKQRNFVIATMSKEDRAKEIATRCHEHVSNLVARISEQESLMGRMNELLEERIDARDDEGAVSDDVFKIVNALTKLNKEARESLKMVKEDGVLQAYVRAGTINNKHGLDEGDVLELVSKMGAALGVEEGEVLLAWTRVRREAAKGLPEPISI